MTTIADLGRVLLFEGLGEDVLSEILGRSRLRHFAAGEALCREGDPGESLFVIEHGVAQVTVPSATGTRLLGRMRRGDVIGEISMLTGEARTATVVATVPTAVLEFEREAFASVIADHPSVLANLTRILSQRLARLTARHADTGRGEAVAIVAAPSGMALLAPAVEQTRLASPRPVAALAVPPAVGVPHAVPDILVALDDLLSRHGTVVVAATPGADGARALVDNVDRTVVLAAAHEVEATMAAIGAGAEVEWVILGDASGSPPPPGARVVRRLAVADAAAAAWLGRHLSRTKLGLALGAGGAKGYAHVGALGVLEDAGYVVDYVSGSSIGAIVGTCIALGKGAAEIDEILREWFAPEIVAEMFKLSLAGTSTGASAMAERIGKVVGDATFDDLVLPLVVMCVDLNSKLPAPISTGSLGEALVAATSLVGLVPPYQRGDQRLVDALALLPVPTDAAVEAGADITVSVNLMSRETLPAWPGEAPPDPVPPGRYRMLDTLMEVMDLAQLDASVRHAERADVVVTPLFGPSSWRDFHLADLFLAAGRSAAEHQLARLMTLARPQHVREP